MLVYKCSEYIFFTYIYDKNNLAGRKVQKPVTLLPQGMLEKNLADSPRYTIYFRNFNL